MKEESLFRKIKRATVLHPGFCEGDCSTSGVYIFGQMRGSFVTGLRCDAKPELVLYLAAIEQHADVEPLVTDEWSQSGCIPEFESWWSVCHSVFLHELGHGLFDHTTASDEFCELVAWFCGYAELLPDAQWNKLDQQMASKGKDIYFKLASVQRAQAISNEIINNNAVTIDRLTGWLYQKLRRIYVERYGA